MPVLVSGYITFRRLIGKERPVELPGEGSSLQELLTLLANMIGADFEKTVYDQATETLLPGVALLVNGRHVGHLSDGMQTPIRDGDEIAIFPPVAGGLK